MWYQVKHKSNILSSKNTKMRSVPRTKWDLSIKTTNYWKQILEDIEAQNIKVRQSELTSFPSLILYLSSKRSVNNDIETMQNSKCQRLKFKKQTIDPVVKISPPSPTHSVSECFNTSADISNISKIERENYLTSTDVNKPNHEIQRHSFKSTASDLLENDNKNTETLENTNINSNTIGLNTNPVALPSFFKISQLSRISKCINDFLAHTKNKVKSGAMTDVINNVVSPEPISDSNIEKIKKFSVTENTTHGPDIQRKLQKSVSVINIDRNDNTEENNTSYSESKKVYFLDAENNENNSISDAEYRPTPRRRAPSIAVASALPSFGKNVSSLEYSDSVDTNSSTGGDLVTPNKHVQLEINQELNKSPANGKHLKIPELKKINTDLYHSRAKLFKPKEFQSSRPKSKYWPKKSIFHVLKALRIMKSSNRRAVKKKKYEDRTLFTASPLEFFSVAKGSSSSAITHDFTDHLTSYRSEECNEEESTSTSLTCSCSYSSVRRRPIEKSSIYLERKVLSSPGFIDDLKIKSDSASRRISSELNDSGINTTDQDGTPSITQKDKSILVLKKIPQIDRLYQRKKIDKCLACLHTSIKENSINFLKFGDMEFSISSMSDDIIINDLNDILHNKSDNNNHDLFNHESEVNFGQSEIQSELYSDNRITEKMKSPTELDLAMNNFPDQFNNKVSPSPYSIDTKSDTGYDKKGIMSTRSLMSNLSLISNHSKTPSDQDDSDQAIDEGGEMEENIVESRSKFLAPCHAPLNFRPSLEPLKALRNKKARSIQSRLASLEKSTEAESDEKSEDDEVPIVVGKVKDINEKKYISSTEENDRFAIPSTALNEEFKENFNCTLNEPSPSILNDLTNLLEQIKYVNELREKYKSNEYSIVDKIFSELNIAQSELEYNTSNSFLSINPILSDSEIIEVAYKLLNQNKNTVEILCELEKIHTKRFMEKFLNKHKNMSMRNKNEQIFKRLLTLLIDSKFYFNYQNSSTNPASSPIQKPSINSRQLRRVLPVKSYNLIAPILGLPEWHPRRWTSVRDVSKLRTTPKRVVTKFGDQSNIKSPGHGSETDIDFHAHPPKKGASSQEEHESWRKKQLNPYGLFITKPRRKAVIWRPLTVDDLEGYDPEATLKRRAAKITDEICTDFCQWLRSLGGFDTTIDEQVLKDMFETDFSADACRAMKISLKELPIVPIAISHTRNCPEAGELERTRRQLMQDAKAENQKTRLVAFGSALPKNLKRIAPKNKVKENWLECKNVPRDLETMNVVWKDIADLDSVQGFLNWIETHSEIELPVALMPSVGGKK